MLIQIWTTLISILFIKYLKQIAKHAGNLSDLVSFLRLNLFVKTDLQYWLDKPFTEPPEPTSKCIQGGATAETRLIERRNRMDWAFYLHGKFILDSIDSP